MTDPNPTCQAALDAADAQFGASLERLFALLRIPSISTDPAYADDVKRCAAHVHADLFALGFDVATHETPGHPMIVAKWNQAEGPRALFYGHYDVQPVDPLDLWDRDPFDPVIETRADGSKKIVARGAADDKGQIMTFIEACRAILATDGALPIPVTILFEGEEESGSPSLPGFLDAHTDDLRADMALVCDTNMWDRDTPAITTRLRGMYGTELVIQAADKDLHSGYFGGAARNPAHVLAAIIADLHDENGAVTLPGFYDGVAEVPDAIMAMWQQLDFSAEAFLGEVGLSVPAGEADRSVLEQIWARPTLEVNGMTSGYTGDGFKTVLPAQASAKISCRLVKGQDPQQVHESFEAFVKARLPADCTATFNTKGMGPGIELDTSGASFVAAQKALTDEWPNPAAFIGVGGSIPIVGDFQNRLGLESVLVGFGLGDDQIHSPNEKYELESYRKGIRSWIRILYALGGSGMNSVCVFCGSNPGNHPDYAAAAEALGNTLAQRGLTLIYGGAEVGLMGTVADAALAAGGEVVGVIPQALVDKEIAHKGLSRLETVGSMHERKARMADLSDGFINLPGGTGTLEEMFEVWTWGQLGFHSKPIGVLNVRGFYDPLMVFLDHQRDEGFVKPGLRETLLSSPDAGALLDAMEAYRPPVVHKWVERKAL